MGPSWRKHGPFFQSSSRSARPRPLPQSRTGRQAILRGGNRRVGNATPRWKHPPRRRILKRPSRRHLAVPQIQLPPTHQLSRSPTASKPPRRRCVKRRSSRRSNQPRRAQKSPRLRRPLKRPNPNQCVRRQSSRCVKRTSLRRSNQRLRAQKSPRLRRPLKRPNPNQCVRRQSSRSVKRTSFEGRTCPVALRRALARGVPSSDQTRTSACADRAGL